MNPLIRRRWWLELRRWAAVVLLTLAAVFITWGIVEPRLVGVSHAVVSDPQVPEGLDGMRIAYVADIHAGTLLGEGHVAHIVDMILALEPEMIVIGGDGVGGDWRTGERRDAEFYYRQIRRLEAPRGVYAVLGNHESGEAAEEARRQYAEAGIMLLENESVRIHREAGYLRLVGVEDETTGNPDLAEAAAEISTGEFTIVASHNPDALPTGLAETRGAYDLALAGHTHGGQVTLFGLWSPVTPSRYGQRYNGGWYEIESVPTLVTRGAGTYQLPIRFFARPEVHLIVLRNGPKSVSE